MNTQLSKTRANGRPAYELLVAGAEDSHMLLQLGSGPYVTIRQVYTDEDGTSFFELLATSQAEQGFVRAFYLIGLQPHRGIVYVRLPDFYAIGLNRGKAHLAESFVDDAEDYIVQFWGPINMRAGKEPENLQVDLKARLFWDDDSRWVSAVGFPTEMLDRIEAETRERLAEENPTWDMTQIEQAAAGQREELEYFEGVMTHLFIYSGW